MSIGEHDTALDTAYLEGRAESLKEIQRLTAENEQLQARLRECDGSLTMYRGLYEHAIKCVDRVFQECRENPQPILPNFLKAGADKFKGVIALAAAFTAERQRADAAEAKLREAEKSLADYAANLGDIVTYGTTADVLDKHLQEWVPRAREAEAKLAAVREYVESEVDNGCISVDAATVLELVKDTK